MSDLVLCYALDPTKDQERQLRSHVGAVRYAYNWGLARVLEDWEQANQAKKQGLEPTYKNYTHYSLRKEFNSVKDTIAPWWKQNSKEAYSTGFEDLNKALNNYYHKRAKRPKFKKKGDNLGIHFTTGTMRLDDNHHFTIPNIGKVRLFENARKLDWLLRNGARVKTCWVKYSQCRWHLSINLDVSDDLFVKYNDQRTKRDRKPAVGVDLGIKNGAVFSDGTVIINPKSYERKLRKLRRLHKRLSRQQRYVLDSSTGEVKQSNRYKRTQYQLQKQYAAITNKELDYSHKLSKQLCDGYQLIGIEDLNVSGMIKNRKLARRLAHASFGRFRVFLTYKSSRYGNDLVVVDRFYPSSKKCSNCGMVRTKLSLNERTYDCDDCGLVMDRDLNAAVNINDEAVRLYYDAQSYGESLNGHGGDINGSDESLSETILDEVSSTIMVQSTIGALL